jgi:hypothetical protein
MTALTTGLLLVRNGSGLPSGPNSMPPDSAGPLLGLLVNPEDVGYMFLRI